MIANNRNAAVASINLDSTVEQNVQISLCYAPNARCHKDTKRIFNDYNFILSYGFRLASLQNDR